MLKIIKMDLYRFFRSPSTWRILAADLMLAVLSIVTCYNTAKNHSLIPIYSNAGKLLAAQINGGILMIICAVSVILFVSAKYKGGFIKNIACQLPCREMLILPEMMVTGVAYALYFFVYSACIIGTGAVYFGNTFISFSLPAIMRLLIVQFLLHWSFCCLLLLFYMLTNSTAFTMAAGLFISFKILNIFYTLIERFTHFDLAQYMLDSNIFQIGTESTKLTYTKAVAVGMTFLLIEIVLLYFVMHKKEIK